MQYGLRHSVVLHPNILIALKRKLSLTPCSPHMFNSRFVWSFFCPFFFTKSLLCSMSNHTDHLPNEKREAVIDWRSHSRRVWQHLVAHRANQQLFLHELAREVEISPRHLNYPLSYIMEFCERLSLPPLTGIVLIKQRTVRFQREYPSAHFRLKHQGQFYYPCNASFDQLYQQKLTEIRAFNWQNIHYEPTTLTTLELQRQWQEAKNQRTQEAPCHISLAQLAKRIHQ